MVTQFLAAAMPATAAAVSMALVLMVVLLAWLVAFCIRMMSGPVAFIAAPAPVPSTSSRTVEEWTYFPNGVVRRIVRSEGTR